MGTALHLSIRSHGFTLTPAIRDYTERRLRFALSHAAGRVIAVTVVLSDINGPRGGQDKRCRMRISVKDQQAMVINDIEDNLYLAIDRAADRAGQTVSRRLGRDLNAVRHPRLRHEDMGSAGDAGDARVKNAGHASLANSARRG